MLNNSEEVQANLNRTLEAICSLDNPDRVELMTVIQGHVNQAYLLTEVNKIFSQNAGGELSYDDWQSMGKVGANIGQDLLVAGSIGKILGDFQSLTSDFPPLVRDPSLDEGELDLNDTENGNITTPDNPL